MVKSLCLDTNVVIEIIKGNKEVSSRLPSDPSYFIYLSSVSIFELYLRQYNLNDLDSFIQTVDILPFDEHSAKVASQIHKELSEKGKLPPLRDLFIGATCIAHDTPLMTFNKKDFIHMDGLQIFS